MKGVCSPKLLFENLDLTPIHPTLWKGLHRQGPGRPVEYQPDWDFKALVLRQLHQIPYVKDLVKRLKRNPILRHACGYRDKAPTEAHFSQMKKRISAEGFKIIEAWLRREALSHRDSQPLSATGLVQAACIVGTDLRAWSSRSLDDNKRGHGDPDARLGRGRKGFYLGYRTVFLTDIEGFPLGHMEASANVNEPLMVEPLLDKVLGSIEEIEMRLAGEAKTSMERLAGRSYESVEMRRFAAKMRNERDHWFTFLAVPGVKPTNNRALREHAVQRGISGAASGMGRAP